MLTTPSVFVSAKNALESAGFVDLISFQPNPDGGDIYYFTNSNEIITYESNDYNPINFSVSQYTQDSAGSTPEVQMSAPDASGTLRSIVREYRGLTGAVVEWKVANLDLLSSGEALDLASFRVTSTVRSNKGVTLYLGNEDLRQYTVPFEVATYKCRHRFATGESGKCTFVALAGDTTDVALSCDKSLSGANGCIAHQNYMDTNSTGDPVELANNFGGFIGVLRGL